MGSPLSGLGLDAPLVAAPMAGGPSTPRLVAAAAGSGSLAFLPAGYLTAAATAERVGELRAAAPAFGVNLFAPNPVPVDPDAFRAYARTIAVEGERFGIDVAETGRIEDDDDWAAKVDLLTGDPVPIVSFTFGIPEARVISALRRAGSLLVQTVTSAAEARAATEAGVDMLAVQACLAGGHLGTLTPSTLPAKTPLPELITQVRAVSPLPVLAAGGIATVAAVAATLTAGATAAMVGTVLLRTEQAGTSAPYRAALADPARTATVITRAFTGRPARTLRNRFADTYGAIAPLGYPALHHLTSPIRRAATAAGDPELINLWAGTGWREAREEPVAAALARLSP